MKTGASLIILLHVHSTLSSFTLAQTNQFRLCSSPALCDCVLSMPNMLS